MTRQIHLNFDMFYKPSAPNHKTPSPFVFLLFSTKQIVLEVYECSSASFSAF